MGTGKVTRYNASAGSGKTYKLTSIYLEKLFESKNSYKRILAVTFTNKAAAEMKRKILGRLLSLSAGAGSEMLRQLSSSTGKSEEELTSAAGSSLHAILHDYSNFSVGTIDSFFQKVLKAFTREIGLNHGYIIEIDHSIILKKAVEEMLSAAPGDKALLDWLTEYSNERTEAGKSWNLRDDILKLSEEIFREKFRMIPREDRDKLKEKDFLNNYIARLKKIQSVFNAELRKQAGECKALLESAGVADSMFLRGDKGGVPSFLKMTGQNTRGLWKPATNTVSQVLSAPPVWTSRSGPSPQLKEALSMGFAEKFTALLEYYNAGFARANTATLILDNIYVLGILSNILEHVHNITSSDNRFLLSDSGELLWLIIRDDQTPFIYEKTGNSFDHFMIDEFQDTSHIQWNNFRPLIENSLAEGKDSLVVGDVKQSIYRWRNSDWNILRSVISEQIRSSGLKDEFLDTNWRSRRKIISFNNSLFTVLPAMVDSSGNYAGGKKVLSELYATSSQNYPGGKEGGYVRIEYIGDEDSGFNSAVLSRLPGLIEKLQDDGYSGSDIGILVRTNREGALVLNTVMEYRNTAGSSKLEKYNYNIISSDSLLLSGSAAVNFIISALQRLFDQDERLSLCIMLRNWLILEGADPLAADPADPESEAKRLFPEGFRAFCERLKERSLFEAVEQVIGFFRLGQNPGNSAYLSAFQDCVTEFSSGNSPDIPSFLSWWENAGKSKSVVVSDKPDSMRVITIHKAKGLEFEVVILPFIYWNTGHGSSAPTLWVSPKTPPFDLLKTVPVRYRSEMQYSEFMTDYETETYSCLADNINLLYVAFTRAISRLYGFCPSGARGGSVAGILKEALSSGGPESGFSSCFDSIKGFFAAGTETRREDNKDKTGAESINSGPYYVNTGIRHLHLKFSSDSWLVNDGGNRKSRINHGLLMHEILAGVRTVSDTGDAVKRMILEGRITESEGAEIKSKIESAVSFPAARSWFEPGKMILNEPVILCSDGLMRRPDRVMSSELKVEVVDFKFGAEKREHIIQVKEYIDLIGKIEKKPVEGYLWYVDENKVIRV
ncbi:MAG TPA: UvrD-helicase domain-containing protein [Bacteroidales bacterium]|nr:UvrD-helicase domain-containing protein [Bacteroidales bacterium]